MRVWSAAALLNTLLIACAGDDPGGATSARTSNPTSRPSGGAGAATATEPVANSGKTIIPSMTDDQIPKTEDEWRKILTADEYHVLREKGTEARNRGYTHNKATGTYYCAGCGARLFESNTKFDSGTGWPSFFQPADDKAVGKEVDSSAGMVRTEVHCARCEGHLGHVFPDGPQPTGQRYCINSVALKFQEQEPKK